MKLVCSNLQVGALHATSTYDCEKKLSVLSQRQTDSVNPKEAGVRKLGCCGRLCEQDWCAGAQVPVRPHRALLVGATGPGSRKLANSPPTQPRLPARECSNSTLATAARGQAGSPALPQAPETRYRAGRPLKSTRRVSSRRREEPARNFTPRTPPGFCQGLLTLLLLLLPKVPPLLHLLQGQG
ncbi:hypothetical protein HPB51_020997 [Rhipicephalus microplus]|uniref:Uncharacterized protein n=1 Tax=Rhipicephalus microplus TaxID=6941 RepID=A0A9J6DCF1_RHIMP|nr:hypothetical protein HPB51_020997 [Rhipicephalus microplus]